MYDAFRKAVKKTNANDASRGLPAERKGAWALRHFARQTGDAGLAHGHSPSRQVIAPSPRARERGTEGEGVVTLPASAARPRRSGGRSRPISRARLRLR